MNEKERQDKIAWLKKALDELDNLGEEEFDKIVRAKFGDGMGDMCKMGKFADYARHMLKTTWQEELRLLGG
jgi:hypothetical protein